jgi:hypothetical protein
MRRLMLSRSLIVGLLCASAILAPPLAVGAELPITTVTATPSPEPSGGEAVLLTDPDLNKCNVLVDGPHYSSGAGGVIAKIRFVCTGSASRKVTSFIGNLYRCPREPARGLAEKQWTTDYGCSPTRSANGPAGFTFSATTPVTRYIPRTGESGAPRGAWFVACVRGYYSTGSTFAAASVPLYW